MAEKERIDIERMVMRARYAMKYLVSLMGTPVIKEIPVRELECLEAVA